VSAIREAFGANEYPGDAYLVGSREGCEPEEEAGAFRGRFEWHGVPSEFLDQHAAALSFFSEAGFRFFLPAYLIADIRSELRTAEPIFHLTNGFSDVSVEMDVGGRKFIRTAGKSTLINPRRYGAMTQMDYARMRLAVLTREEAGAIVAYLRWKLESEGMPSGRSAIQAALDGYWLERARTAPTAAELREHLNDEAEFVRALREVAIDNPEVAERPE